MNSVRASMEEPVVLGGRTSQHWDRSVAGIRVVRELDRHNTRLTHNFWKLMIVT